MFWFQAIKPPVLIPSCGVGGWRSSCWKPGLFLQGGGLGPPGRGVVRCTCPIHRWFRAQFDLLAFPSQSTPPTQVTSSSHQVVVLELSLILPVACNRRKMRRSWKSVFRRGFPRHAVENSLCSRCVWLESASLTLWNRLQQKPLLMVPPPTYTHTCCTHRIKENCDSFLSVLSCGWRTIHLRCRLVKIVCLGLLSKTASSAAGLQGNCLGPHSNPPLSASPML